MTTRRASSEENSVPQRSWKSTPGEESTDKWAKNSGGNYGYMRKTPGENTYFPIESGSQIIAKIPTTCTAASSSQTGNVGTKKELRRGSPWRGDSGHFSLAAGDITADRSADGNESDNHGQTTLEAPCAAPSGVVSLFSSCTW